MENENLKKEKFIELAGKRVNNVIHDIDILTPMAKSSNYEYTKEDVESMFSAMQEALDTAKIEFNKRFEGKVKNTKKVFKFGENKSEIKDTDFIEDDCMNLENT